MVDRGCNEQRQENQQCKHSGHHCLRAQIFQAKEKGEAQRYHGSEKKDEPYETWNNPQRKLEPKSSFLGYMIELVEDLGDHDGVAGIICRVRKNRPVDVGKSLASAGALAASRHLRPVVDNSGLGIVRQPLVEARLR